MSISVESLKSGTKVNYGMFSNVTYKGLSQSGKEVLLVARSGNTKQVYVDLFEKHASLKK